VANNVLADKPLRSYSDAEIEQAVSALEAALQSAKNAVDALIDKVPDRYAIGEREFATAFGQDHSEGRLLRMRPTTIGARMEYSLKALSPNAKANQFALMDVFIAGHMKNGNDLFEYDSRPTEIGHPFIHPGIARLRGIDIPKMYDDEFANYERKAKSGYAAIIEALLAQLSPDNREAINSGTLRVHILQPRTGPHLPPETGPDGALTNGRLGFIIECDYLGQHQTFEVFPLAGIIQRRTDLAPIVPKEMNITRIVKIPGVHYPKGRTIAGPMNVDWNAYNTVAAPRPGIISTVIPKMIKQYKAQEPIIRTLSSDRFKDIASLISNSHLFFDRDLVYEQHLHKTASERTADNYPLALRFAEMLIPGLSCLTAGTKGGSVANCVLDLGSILLLPAFKFASGSLTLASKINNLGTRTFPVFRGLAHQLVKSAGISYWQALNPALPLAALGKVFKTVFQINRLARNLSTLIKTRTGRAGTYRLTSGVHTPASAGTWRPLRNNDLLGQVNHVPNVPIRHLPPCAITRGAYHLIKPSSGLAYGPRLLEKRTKVPFFNPPQRIKTHIGYVQSPPSTPKPATGKLGKRLENTDELDTFLTQNGIEATSQKVGNLRAELLDGTPIYFYTRKDGSKGLVMHDVWDKLYTDAFNNGTIYVGKTYNYKALGTWLTDSDDTRLVVNIPLGKLNLSREKTITSRLESIREAIEEGIPLPPVEVRKSGDFYNVINGNHRVNIADQLELQTVPAIIVD
jgi:hypothetical protein